MNHIVYTVGHSNHEIGYFHELLLAHNINCIIDVRSVPASTYTPQFNKENLRKYLLAHNIQYLHFGEEFGARRTDDDCIDENGQIDFQKVCQTAKFLKGVERLKKGLAKNFNISLMCSEAEPIECHRFALISRYLEDSGFNVWHILKDKSIKNQKEVEKEMIEEYMYKGKIPTPLANNGQFALFEDDVSDEERRNKAYLLKNKEIGYINKPELELETIW